MRATEFLTELFDKTVPYVWKEAKINATLVAEFNIGEFSYQVLFRVVSGTRYEVAFLIEYNKPIKRGSKIHKVKQRSFNITGTGNQYLVFTTVMKIIEDFLGKVKPTSLEWSADKDEDSRISLYGSMLTRLESRINRIGYEIAPRTGHALHGFDTAFMDFVIVKSLPPGY